MNSESKERPKIRWSDRDVDLVISFILRAGVLVSSALAAVGGVIYLLKAGGEKPEVRIFHVNPQLTSVSGIISGAIRGDGSALMQMGVVLLLLTPILRVLFAGYAFAQKKDMNYVVISGFVLAVLLFSLLGKH